MNLVTMTIVVCLSGILLMSPSSDAVKHRICHVNDVHQAYLRHCRRSQQEEAVALGVDAEEPSKSEGTMQPASPATTFSDEGKEEPAASWVELQGPPRSLGIDSLEEGLAPGRQVGRRRQRSIYSSRGPFYDLLLLCCNHGCSDEVIARELC